MIPKEFKVELLGKVDIVEVIDQHVRLKKSGINYVACCPFHHEKTPSFTVSREKQFYHCFGCHAHGDAISFVMNYVGLDFVNSIEKLASLAGLTVPRIKGDFNFKQRTVQKQKEDLLKKYYRQAANYFFDKKHAEKSSLHYLSVRGLSAEIMEKYQVGYAPGYNYLEEVFSDSSVYQDLVTGGLVSQKDQQYFPRFRNRIMFPIRNIEGDVIGFGGRVIDKGEPKYLNSPETILFDKSQCLYGLFEVKNQIRALQKVVVVEGYVDVISMVQHGIDYTVATLGTAITGQHIQVLFRFSSHIYFCFDGDEAGRKAAWRALTNSLEYLKDDRVLYFVFLPEGEDPDSYIRKYGKQGFEDFVATSATPLSQYFIQHVIADKNLQYGEGKAEIIKIVKPLLLQLKATSLRFMIMKDLVTHLQMSMAELNQLIDGGKKTQLPKSYRQGNFPAKSIPKTEVTSYNKKMLSWLLRNPKLALYLELPDYLKYSDEVECLLVLSDTIKANNHIKNAVQLEAFFSDTKFSVLIHEILMESLKKDGKMTESNVEDMEENFKHGIVKIKREIIEIEIFQLKELMKQRSLSEDEEQLLMHLLTLQM